MDLEALRRSVENEINNYQYSVPSTAAGNPISAEQIKAELAAMLAALVSPHWVEAELRDTFGQVTAEAPPSCNCVVVADDARGNLLLFDPVENDFLLAQRQDGQLRSIGVRGDAVGCFMAR